MGFLKEVSNEQARAKVGIFGSQGTGKTTTAALLAIAVSKTYHNSAPVACMDTENGSDYLKPIFDAEGVKFLVHKSGAFADMVPVLREAEKMGCCAFIMDSVTHTWREIVESYCTKRAMNFSCASCGKYSKDHPTQYCKDFKPRDYAMQFQDWKPVKAEWARWTNAFLNSQLHCFIAGRAGYEYEYQENEETHKKELIKGDTKMKAEGEFGYEPSLLIEMDAQRQQTTEKHRGGSFVHVAYILKDRARSLNGKHFEFPDINQYKAGDWKKVFKVFEPHFSFLNIGGTQRAMDSNNSEQLFDAGGDSERDRRSKQKKIAEEECISTMQLLWPGQDVKTKNLRINILDAVWGTRAWTAVENMPLEKVEAGLHILRRYEAEAKTAPGVDTEEGVLALLHKVKTNATIEGHAPAEDIPQVPRAEIPNFDKPSQIVYPETPKREPGQDEEEESEIEVVAMNGSLYLSGNGTFHVKEEIKKLGGRWSKDRKSWQIPATKRSDLKTLCDGKNIALVDAA